MNAVQIIQNLCVKLRQLLVQTDDPVSLALAAFFLVRTAAAILALKIFLCSAVFIAPYRPAVNEMEFLSVRVDWQTTFIDREIYRSVWIVAIFLVLAFFFIHGKLHEFFPCRVLRSRDNYYSCRNLRPRQDIRDIDHKDFEISQSAAENSPYLTRTDTRQTPQ